MRSTRPPKEPFDGKKRESNILARRVPAPARYSRLLCARARAALLPVRYSCPGGARYPFVAKYEHARYPCVAKYEHPPGTGTTRGASTPGHGHYPGCEPGLPVCCSSTYPSMCSCPSLPLRAGQ